MTTPAVDLPAALTTLTEDERLLRHSVREFALRQLALVEQKHAIVRGRELRSGIACPGDRRRGEPRGIGLHAALCPFGPRPAARRAWISSATVAKSSAASAFLPAR